MRAYLTTFNFKNISAGSLNALTAEVSEEASKHENSSERELQGITACFPKQSRWVGNAEGVSTTNYKQQQTTEFVDSHKSYIPAVI